MKKLVLLLSVICLTSLTNCSSDDGGCGTHAGKALYKGPEGGCYYINSGGNKTYVDRSECNC